MTEILADLNRRIHDISLHMGTDDFERNIACVYAIEDALNDAKSAAQVMGIAF